MKTKNFYAKNYFFGLSLTILILGLIAFSDNLIFDVGQESNSNPVFIIHGLLMYAWVIVLIIQTNRIRKLKFNEHMRFGQIGFVVSLLFILSTAYIYLFYVNTPWQKLFFNAKANRIFLPVFALMILASYIYRRKVELHKHLIFVGMLLIMEPILTRVAVSFGLNAFITAPIIWLILWASLFIYDFVSKRRIHPLTYGGLIFWFAVYITIFLTSKKP